MSPELTSQCSFKLNIYISLCTERVVEDGGLALIADYGHLGEEGDTFRAFKHHSQINPLVGDQHTLGFKGIISRYFCSVADPDPHESSKYA